MRRYPDLDRPVMVSTDGGSMPVWSREGREIYYRRGDLVMAVRMELGAQPGVGQPTQLFTGRYTGTAGDTRFDVAAAGRFVMVKSDPASELRRLAIVLNWFEATR